MAYTFLLQAITSEKYTIRIKHSVHANSFAKCVTRFAGRGAVSADPLVDAGSWWFAQRRGREWPTEGHFLGSGSACPVHNKPAWGSQEALQDFWATSCYNWSKGCRTAQEPSRKNEEDRSGPWPAPAKLFLNKHCPAICGSFHQSACPICTAADYFAPSWISFIENFFYTHAHKLHCQLCILLIAPSAKCLGPCPLL